MLSAKYEHKWVNLINLVHKLDTKMTSSLNALLIVRHQNTPTWVHLHAADAMICVRCDRRKKL